jgi:hypothetical protein
MFDGFSSHSGHSYGKSPHWMAGLNIKRKGIPIIDISGDWLCIRDSYVVMLRDLLGLDLILS